MQLSSKRRTKSTLHRNMYVVHCAVDGTASTAGGLISLDIDASLIYTRMHALDDYYFPSGGSDGDDCDAYDYL